MTGKVQPNFIISISYFNVNSVSGKEIILKQEYFLLVLLYKILFMNLKNKFKWEEFPKYNYILLNDTHPILALVYF